MRRTRRLVAIATGLCVLLSSCSSAGPLETVEATAAVAALLDANGEGSKLESCPFDPLGQLLSEAVAEIDSPDVVTALQQPLEVFVGNYGDDATARLYLSCDRIEPEGAPDEFAGMAVSAAPVAVDELFDLLEQAGLNPVDRKGFVFNPISWGWRLSDRDLSVNYVTASVKPA